MNSRLLPTLALFVAAGIFFVYVNPTWSGSITDTKAKIALDNQALDAARQYAAQQNVLADARDAIDASSLERLSTFLPDSVDNVGLILDLNALAARSGLSLANIDVVTNDIPGTKTAPAATSPVGSVNLSLSAVGTFSALQTFLIGVERSARLLDIQDVVVKGSDTGVYTYQMTLRLYWLR
ncbi:MAG: type 4a pilus biogenesis protein PilO [Candidatus Pacebacteria bacterium]|jgi:Tfp pilus assembly protein PilO|nr:type 4a pilus biogenesis protein PilO [Candidatus Paceibacterota bacterium]